MKNIDLFKLDIDLNSLLAFIASLLICFFLKNTNWLISRLKLSKILD